jgi:hypothetical protein
MRQKAHAHVKHLQEAFLPTGSAFHVGPSAIRLDIAGGAAESKPSPSPKIFSFDAGGTVYSRAEGVSGGNGMVGFALNAVKLCGAGNGQDSSHFFVRREPSPASFILKPGRTSLSRGTCTPTESRRKDRTCECLEFS